MLPAVFGIIAATAFVLGLGAIALWLLKRAGAIQASPRARVPVEVVQRVSLGPKTGLAVVRVGETVMAVSVGDGGVRPLFELGESDRQRVLATAPVSTPLASSAQATAAFARHVPGTLGRTLRDAVRRETAATSAGRPAAVEPSVPAPAAANDHDFRAILGMSLGGATRLAVLVGACVVGGALAPLSPSALGAQAAPVTLPPPPPGAALPRPAAPAAVPQQGGGSTGAQAIAAAPTPPVAPAAATTAPDARAAAATTAPVAGGDDALARLVPQMDISLGSEKEGGLRLSGTVGIVVMMGLLTLLPTLLLMMTGFTRILIVLHFLKQAMGTQGVPPAQLIAGLALLLTGFVMGPALAQVHREAITPWLDGRITQVEMLQTGVKPMREFMLRQTKATDLKAFVEMSRMEQPQTPDDVPLHVLMSAFVASELRTAFQIGFAIYLPFIVIDAVVASVLMSMGMFMLPPAMISLPFKLLLFVLVDGWSLTITSLVQSFR
jgi:flagellar biosynthetic protein FliP